MRADEECLYDHLIPGVFGEALDRIRITMGHGLKDGLDA